MRRMLVCALVLATCLVPSAVSAEEDLSRCDAVELEDRPELGQTENWKYRRYQRRHNEYQRNHPDVFASGYLSGKHFYVGFTHDVCLHLKRFRDGLPQKWRVRAFHANWTFRELRRAQECANDHFGKRWLAMSGTSTDVWRNKVLVMFEKNTERRRNFIEDRCGTVDFYFREGKVRPE